MLSYLCTCFPPFPPPLSALPPRRTNPTNTIKVILTVMCTCAPLLPPKSHLTSILATLRSALPLEIADDQPSRLAKPPSISLADRLMHVISRLSFICIQVFVRRSHLPKITLTTDKLCSSPHPFKQLKAILFWLVSMSNIKTMSMCP